MVYKDNRETYFQYGGDFDVTNNRMEALALWRALKSIEHNAQDEPVTIYSDSKLSVDTYNTYLVSWERNGWRKSDGKKPENLSIWKLIAARKKRLPNVAVKWVKGHGSSVGNHRADELTHLARSPFK
jgi:ribonuclease HI